MEAERAAAAAAKAEKERMEAEQAAEQERIITEQVAVAKAGTQRFEVGNMVQLEHIIAERVAFAIAKADRERLKLAQRDKLKQKHLGAVGEETEPEKESEEQSIAKTIHEVTSTAIETVNDAHSTDTKRSMSNNIRTESQILPNNNDNTEQMNRSTSSRIHSQRSVNHVQSPLCFSEQQQPNHLDSTGKVQILNVISLSLS